MTEELQVDQHGKAPSFYFGLAFLIGLLVLLAVGVVKLSAWLEDEQKVPLQNIVISGDVFFVNDSDIKALVLRTQPGSFFELNVDETHRAVEALPWVYRASVRKRWPSGLEIFVVEQTPTAMWNGDALLNRNGEIFNGLTVKSEHLNRIKLPSLFGPGGSEQTALQGYRDMQSLLDATSLNIVEMFLSERFAWNLQLDNGIRLNLGRIEFIDRLQRFVDLYPLISEQGKQVDYVDLRYDTGLAVGWKTADSEA